VTALIEKCATDDPTLIELFNDLVEGILAQFKPEELYLLQIDNWFDHKWLGFSGYGDAKSPFPYIFGGRFESVKVEVRSDKLTMPPFNPNRIASQRCFVRSGTSYMDTPLSPPHKFSKGSSKLNLQRRIENAFSSACLVWYSSNTITNDRASLMVYTVKGEKVASWYASFHRKDG
jgi:hypothetical protein